MPGRSLREVFFWMNSLFQPGVLGTVQNTHFDEILFLMTAFTLSLYEKCVPFASGATDLGYTQWR